MTVLLGRTTAGTSADFTAVNNPTAWKFVAAASGTLTSLFIHKKVANASMTSIELAIYDDSAGGTRPGARLGQGSTSTGVTGTGVIPVTGLSVAITSGVTYWIAWRGIGSRMDFQGTAAGVYVENIGAAAFADPWPTGNNNAGTIDAILWGEDAGAGTPGGSATSAVAFSSTVTGRRIGQRAATSTVAASSVASGRRVGRRSAATTVAFASAATGDVAGVETHSGSAATTAGFSSTASGRRVSQASHDEVSALPPFATTVAGALTTVGVVSVASGDSSAVETHSGSASTSAGIASTASGRRVSRGSAVTTTGSTSTASGRRISRGTASSTLAAGAGASGRRVGRRTCATAVGFSSSASGSSSSIPVHSGSALSSVGVSSSATGRRVSRGSCSTACSMASFATGRLPDSQFRRHVGVSVDVPRRVMITIE